MAGVKESDALKTGMGGRAERAKYSTPPLMSG